MNIYHLYHSETRHLQIDSNMNALSKNNFDAQASIDRMNRMHQQQTAKTYKKRNYFDVCRECPQTYVDQRCRSEMITWMKNVANCLGFSNTTVLYSADYVDRFLSQKAPLVHDCLSSRRQYQLLTMTCFYIAVKIHEPKVLSLELLVEMSSFKEADFREMELTVMRTLEWNLYGPTAILFIDEYLDLIISSLEGIQQIPTKSVKDQILDLATEELLNIELDDSIALCLTPSQIAGETMSRIKSKLITVTDFSISILSRMKQSGIFCDVLENMQLCCDRLMSSTNDDCLAQSSKQEILETESHASPDCVSKIDRRLSIERISHTLHF